VDMEAVIQGSCSFFDFWWYYFEWVPTKQQNPVSKIQLSESPTGWACLCLSIEGIV
jgi:hypothetical protein